MVRKLSFTETERILEIAEARLSHMAETLYTPRSQSLFVCYSVRCIHNVAFD